MRIVMKFGGSSVGDGDRIKHVAHLVKHFLDEGNKVIVVTSALGGITDLLLKMASKAAIGVDSAHIKEFIINLAETHSQAALDAIGEQPIASEVLEKIDSRLEGLERVLNDVCCSKRLTARSLDYISSYGERLSAPILSGALRLEGVNSMAFTGGEAGIVTTSDYGNASPLERTYQQVQEKLGSLIENSVPVISGFIAKCESDTVTTLGRGGSDFTASIIAAAIHADEIWLWKDVPGIMTADPKIVPEAQVIHTISYIEAMEMSYFGAKILHPRAIEPAIRHGIPVRVKSTFEPELNGTLIVKEEKKIANTVKAVSVITDMALINISGVSMIGHVGVAAHIFTTLADAGVNITMISQASSEANISLVVERNHLDMAIAALQSGFKNGIIRNINYDKRIGVVAVVGSGMAGMPGVSGRVFSAIGMAKINVIMISQGSSQHNISFVVSIDDAYGVVRILHREFGLDKMEIFY
ncbi:MAG: aspartate kinase [Methanosarcinales archaeon]|nr:MAG: aspartate kinase [Methanosarcinales archaeon]